MSEHKPLTRFDVAALAATCEAARRSRKVARIQPEGITIGTARCVGDQNGNFATEQDDIRDCWLRVTTDMGWEVFWPMAELMGQVGDTFFPDYDG